MIARRTGRKSITIPAAIISNPWPVIKPIAGHLGADYGMQSPRMATQKNGCIFWRLAHVAIIAAAHLAVAMTSEATPRQRAEYVAFNAVTHFAADSIRLPKWADQAIHIAAAAYAGLRWLKGPR